MPISAMMESCWLRDRKRQKRAETRRGQRGEDRQRVDKVLVKNAQHEIDGDEGGDNQEQRRGLLLLKCERLAGQVHMYRGRYVQVLRDLPDLRQHLADAHILSRVEADRHGRELASVSHGEGNAGEAHRGKRR